MNNKTTLAGENTDMLCCHCPLESDTRELAAELADAVKKLYLQRQARNESFELSIWLQGDLGAGKTTLARELIRSLGVQERIKSPTYSLVEEYRSGTDSQLTNLPVLHLDLYRLGDPAELEYIGVPEILSGALALIEWPQQGKGWLPGADLLVQIEDQPGGRMFSLRAQSSLGEGLISSVL